MNFPVDEELAGWFKSRGMDAPSSVEITDTDQDLFVRHFNQAKSWRNDLSAKSRENWAIWATLTHPGHVTDWAPPGTREPLATRTAPKEEVMPSVSGHTQSGSVTAPQVEPDLGPVVHEHYTHVGLGYRGWMTIVALVLGGEVAIHVIFNAIR